MYDSRPTTLAHIEYVQQNTVRFCQYLLTVYPVLFTIRFCWHLLEQVKSHDASKLEEPELSWQNEREPLLLRTKYGSEAYMRIAHRFLACIQHHNMSNPHHPEYWSKTDEEIHDGTAIARMPYAYEIEMLMDWEAAGRRLRNSSFGESIRINQQRLGFDDNKAEFYREIGRAMGWVD